MQHALDTLKESCDLNRKLATRDRLIESIAYRINDRGSEPLFNARDVVAPPQRRKMFRRQSRDPRSVPNLKPASLKTNVPKVCLQRADLAGRDDRPDISVGTHEHPITAGQSVGIA